MSLPKYMDKGLTPCVLQKLKENLGETDEIREKCLEELKNLIAGELDLYPRLEDEFLLRFLRGRQYNVASAFDTYKNYFTFKARYSGVITDFKPSQLKEIFEQEFYMFLEHRDQNDIGMGYIRFGMCDIEQYGWEKIMACTFMASEISANIETMQVVGFSMVVDCSNVSFKKARYFLAPSLLYIMFVVLPTVVPLSVNSLHILNEPFYASFIYKIVRPFFTKALQKRIYFHGDDLKSLHQHVTPDALPEELGGTKGPMWMKKFLETVLSYEDYFEEINKFGYKGKTLQQLRKDKPEIDTQKMCELPDDSYNQTLQM